MLNPAQPHRCYNCGNNSIKRAEDAIKSPRYKNLGFCSTGCMKEYESQSLLKNDKLNSCNVGAISELIVCSDLLKQGYETYRAVSQASNGDIVAFKDEKFRRIEVRTGRYYNGKSLKYPTSNIRAEYIAVVTHRDNKAHYFPDL